MPRPNHREIDPETITPLNGRVLIKRDAPPAEKAGIILPGKKDYKIYEGTIVKLPEDLGRDFENEDTRVGQHAWFNWNIGEDDTAFLTWQGDNYALIPAEALLGVGAAA